MEPRKALAQYIKVRTVLLYMFNIGRPVCLSEIRYDAHNIAESAIRISLKQLVDIGYVEYSHTYLRNSYYKLTKAGQEECYPNTVVETDPLVAICKSLAEARKQVMFNYSNVAIRSLHYDLDNLISRAQQLLQEKTTNG